MDEIMEKVGSNQLQAMENLYKELNKRDIVFTLDRSSIGRIYRKAKSGK